MCRTTNLILKKLVKLPQIVYTVEIVNFLWLSTTKLILMTLALFLLNVAPVLLWHCKVKSEEFQQSDYF